MRSILLLRLLLLLMLLVILALLLLLLRLMLIMLLHRGPAARAVPLLSLHRRCVRPASTAATGKPCGLHCCSGL